jgi:hypothetical protein
LWPAAERAGLPVALLAANFLPLVGQVAERHPGLKLIIDHLGRRSPATTGEATWDNLPQLLEAAALTRPSTPAVAGRNFSGMSRSKGHGERVDSGSNAAGGCIPASA